MADVPAGFVPQEQMAFLQQQLADAQGQINALMGQLMAQQAAQAAAPPPLPPQNGSKLAQPAPFKGSDEKHVHVQAWLFSLNCYFRAANIVLDRHKIDYAVCLFQGHASQWYRLQCLRVPDGEPYATWADLQQALVKQFTPVNYEKRARDRLAALKQVTSVRRYIQEFTDLCLEIPDLHPSEQFHRFVQGLKPNVRREVELQDPQTFDEATKVAERVDSISFAHRSEPPRAPAPRPSYSRPEPMELGSMDVDRRRPSAAANLPSRLSAEDRRRLRDSNACFYCRQPGHIMSRCPSRPGNSAQNPARNQGQGNVNGTNPRAR
jgi:hypothetical protein